MNNSDAIAALFDFERVMELALKALFTAREIKAFTTQTTITSGDAGTDAAAIAAGWDILDFQKDRPRVEIMFTPGAGQGRFRATQIGDSEVPVETSWVGQFKIDIITSAEMKIHAAFRSLVRFILHTQLLAVNGDALTQHKIQSFYTDGGTSPVTKAEEGMFQTTMLLDIHFSIQDDAWATLNSA